MGPYGQSAGGVLQRVVAGDGTRSLSTNAVVIAPTKIVCKFPTARNSGGLAASVIRVSLCWENRKFAANERKRRQSGSISNSLNLK
jgi:hypothetical protein